MSKDENKNDNGNRKTPAEMVVRVLVLGLFVFLLIGIVAAGLYVLFTVLRPLCRRFLPELFVDWIAVTAVLAGLAMMLNENDRK